MKRLTTDILVIGSGAGGAMCARELARAGREVLLIEKAGAGQTPSKDGKGLCVVSDAGLRIYRAVACGGSTVVSDGNLVRCLEKELLSEGIHLDTHYRALERELAVGPYPRTLLGKETLRLMSAAKDTGYSMSPMPKHLCKGIPDRCDARTFLGEAGKAGLKMLTGTRALRVLTSKGRAAGVLARGPGGALTIAANTVIAAAGALETPLLLRTAGIKNAGKHLFVDTQLLVYGLSSRPGTGERQSMAAVHTGSLERHGFTLSTFTETPRGFFTRLDNSALILFEDRAVLGFVLKIRDENAGGVSDKKVTKKVTRDDARKLERGTEAARKILLAAGALPASIVASGPEGSHPGGTCAIGRVAGPGGGTRIKGLYVCDASLLPEPPGLPPMLTVMALAKHIAAHIAIAH